MRVEAREVSPVVRDVVVELPPEKVGLELDRMYRELGRTAKVPGFRPGKVPRSVLERRYSHDVNMDVAARLVRGTSHDALKEASVEPIADPVVQQIAVSPGAAYTYTMRCEVWPRVEVQGFEGLDATQVEVVIPDEEVDREVERVRQTRAQLTPVAGRTTVAQGDHVTLSYDAFIDGKVFEGGSARDRQVEVGAGTAIPGFEEALAGAEVGKAFSFTLTLPAELKDKVIAGKVATFKATVGEIKEKLVPALDDDFAKELAPHLSTFAELREDVRKHLGLRAQDRADREVNEQLIDKLIAAHTFEVPTSLVDSELEDALREAKMSLSMMGITPEQLNLDERKLRVDLRPRAERRARQRVLLGAIADKELVEVADDEVEGRIRSHAEATGQALSKVRQNFQKGRAKERLRSQIREEKVLTLVRAKANITFTAPPPPPVADEAAPVVETPSEGA